MRSYISIIWGKHCLLGKAFAKPNAPTGSYISVYFPLDVLNGADYFRVNYNVRISRVVAYESFYN